MTLRKKIEKKENHKYADIQLFVTKLLVDECHCAQYMEYPQYVEIPVFSKSFVRIEKCSFKPWLLTFLSFLPL